MLESLLSGTIRKFSDSNGKQDKTLFQETSPGEGNGNPLQYSCLENPIDRGAWWATVHGVAKSLARLSNFTFFFSFKKLTV